MICGGIAMVAGMIVPVADPIVMLVVVEAFLLLAPLVQRAINRKFDVFEPITGANVALFQMFVVRPLSNVAYGEYVWRGRNVHDLLPAAMGAAIVGTLALQIGYHFLSGSTVARLSSRMRSPVAAGGSSLAIPAALIVAGTLALVLVPQSTESISAYIYYIPMFLVPGCLLALAIGLSERRSLGVVLATVALLVGLAAWASTGQRSMVLLILLPFVAYALYLRRDRRPRVLVLVALGVIALPFVASFGDLTQGESVLDMASAVGRAAGGSSGLIKGFLVGPDTEMLSALSDEVASVPRYLDHQPGSAITSLVAQPVPRLLWPSKPRQADDLLNEYFFGSVGYAAGGAGAAYSLFGGFYFDSGIFGIATGALVVGLALRFGWEYFRQDTASPIRAMQIAAAMPFVIILMRGNVQDTLSRAMFVLVPLIAFEVVARPATRPWPRRFQPRARAASGGAKGRIEKRDAFSAVASVGSRRIASGRKQRGFSG